jgi:hypothetical protein
MANPEIVRNPNAQSKRSLRHHEQRALNHAEQGGAFTVHSAYATVAAESSEGDAEWGDAFFVLDYERLCLFIDATQGAATGVVIAFQSTWIKDASEDDWYDVMTDADGDGSADVYNVEVALADDAKVALTVPTCGIYMRAKVWMPSADTSSRVIVKGARLMVAS